MGFAKENINVLFSSNKLIIPLQFYLRLIGLLCCMLSIIQFGLGGSVTRYLSNVDHGAWWCTISVFLAGICATIGLNRMWVRLSCLLSFFGFVTALIGSIFEGLTSRTFKSLTSCGSIHHSGKSPIINDAPASFRDKLVSYGNSNGAVDISYCMATYQMVGQFEYDSCYCVSSGGGFCGVYTLSRSSLSSRQNCGSIISTYSKMVSASLSFCTISTFAVLVLFIFNLYLLFSKRYFVDDDRFASMDALDLLPLTVGVSPVEVFELEGTGFDKMDNCRDNLSGKDKDDGAFMS